MGPWWPCDQWFYSVTYKLNLVIWNEVRQIARKQILTSTNDIHSRSRAHSFTDDYELFDCLHKHLCQDYEILEDELKMKG